MGLKDKISGLEQRLAIAESQARLAKEVIDYILKLSELPEDAVLLYTLSGNRVSHEIGKSARILLERLKHEGPDYHW